jgi:hypothetical protein
MNFTMNHAMFSFAFFTFFGFAANLGVALFQLKTFLNQGNYCRETSSFTWFG